MQRGLYNQGLSIFPSSAQLSALIQISLIAVPWTARLFGLPGKPDGTAADVEQQKCKNKSSLPHFTPDLKASGQGKSKKSD